MTVHAPGESYPALAVADDQLDAAVEAFYAMLKD